MSEKGSFIISGIAYWAKVQKGVVNDAGVLEYTMDLSIDSKTKLRLEGLGLPIKNNDVKLKQENKTLQGDFVRLKGRTKPKIIDSKKQDVAENIEIGNGSNVNVLTNVYDWAFKKKSGKSLGLQAIQIVNLVEFKRNGDISSFSELDGYTTNQETAFGGEFVEETDLFADVA